MCERGGETLNLKQFGGANQSARDKYTAAYE